MSSEAAVIVDRVSKRYELYARPIDRLKQFLAGTRRRYFQEYWALKDVSLTVGAGEAFGLLGRNGSGKSTLLQIIAGTLRSSEGHVRTSGQLAALLELGAGFNPEFTGRENVWLSASLLGLGRDAIAERFDEIAAFAEIGEYMDQPVKVYSSGMYVRLAFAVQACTLPDVLIIDEALAVGDEKFQRKCFDHLETLRERGCAILLVSHSTDALEKFCDRAALLHQGVLHGTGPTNEVVDQYHALLYSDERAYVRYLNMTRSGSGAGVDPPVPTEGDGESGEDAAGVDGADEGENDSGDARIVHWEVVDEAGNPCEVFRLGERARIIFTVEARSAALEVQAGILLRTTEGLPVFGTSTLYAGKNLRTSERRESLNFSFAVRLQLSPGSYFLTLAAAEAITATSMRYLDRRTDVVVLKVVDPRAPHTGVAALETAIESWVS